MNKQESENPAFYAAIYNVIYEAVESRIVNYAKEFDQDVKCRRSPKYNNWSFFRDGVHVLTMYIDPKDDRLAVSIDGCRYTFYDIADPEHPEKIALTIRDLIWLKPIQSSRLCLIDK